MKARKKTRSRARAVLARSGYVGGSGRDQSSGFAAQTVNEMPPPPTAPLLQHTSQQLDNAVQRLHELITRVRSAKHSVFGVAPSPSGGGSASTTQKEPTISDIIRGQAGTLHDRLTELEGETSQLINQLL